MSSSNRPSDADQQEDEDALLDAEEAGEEIASAEEGDVPMDSDPEDNDDALQTEIDLQNDSIAHFDAHTDSIFSIAAHPLDPNIVATGSGDDSAYVFSTAAASAPLLPASYESNPRSERASLTPIAHLIGHTDSVSSLAFTLPAGTFLLTGGLDGRLRVYACPPPTAPSPQYTFVVEAQEVEEIAWLTPSPHPSHPNVFALGASDGSVWVYAIDHSAANPTARLQVLQAYYLHTGPTTAGAWTPDGKLLASVAEDGSLYVHDIFGDAAAAGVEAAGQALIGLTAADRRFAIEGGLYSVAIAPSGAFLAAGGAGGVVHIVGLPVLPNIAAAAAAAGPTTTPKTQKGRAAAPGGVGSAGQPGALLATLGAQADGVETLAFAAPPLALLAAGSVDGSVVLFDTGRRFAVRRHLKEAHGDQAVVQVEFARPSSRLANVAAGTASSATAEEAWVLTSCGMDGVVRRWDARGGGADGRACLESGRVIEAAAKGWSHGVRRWQGQGHHGWR